MSTTPFADPGPAGAAAHGMAQLQAGRREEAETWLRRALAHNPQDPTALLGLGILAHQAGRLQEALALFDRGIAAAPLQPALHVNQGVSLAACGDDIAAIAAFERALALDPASSGAAINLSNALARGGRLDEAVAALESLLANRPNEAQAWNNLGNLLKDRGEAERAIAAYDQALAINPLLQVCASNRLAALKVTDRSAPEILAAHRQWSAWFEDVCAEAPLLSQDLDPRRRLRVGFVSPDCHTAVPAFLDAVLAALDREAFEVFAYFNNPQEGSRLARIGLSDHWRVMRGLDDATVAQRIHADQIDVLVDIAGHTGHNRLGVFARRPAPVQLTWLDYLCTTGLEAMDFRLTDAIADPPGAEVSHAEHLLRFPRSQWCWEPDPAAPPVSALPALATGSVTFGSFNNAQKLTDATLDLWRGVLAALPEARLLVAGIAEGQSRTRIRERLAVEEGRVEFAARCDVARYRRLFERVDIALDAMPFSGATTTLDALWQGVPVLTLPGETSCSRSAASLLTQVGAGDWIANDHGGFIAAAVRLSRDLPGLAAQRAALRERVVAGGVTDAGRFAGELGALLRQAWVDCCERFAPGAETPRIDAHRGLAEAVDLLDRGRFGAAMPMLQRVVHAEPQWQLAQRELVRGALAWARQHPEVRAAWADPPQVARPSVSAIVCSVDPARLAAVSAALSAQFSTMPFELVAIGDARSLSEGFNRGAARAHGDVLVFCHDDIAFPHADFGRRVCAHLEATDLVGVAGASQLVNGNWTHAGPPYLHGQVLHRPPAGDGMLYYVAGLHGPLLTPVLALDGAFVACRREVWERTPYDERCFDGFHLYDIDFSLRAQRAGFRVGVAQDLLLIHFSAGKYDLEWQRYNRRFLDKFPDLGNQPGRRRRSPMQVRLQTLEQVEQLHATLRHWRFGDLSSTDSFQSHERK
ncbi:MAG TPA: tetratricopeptide repeat protein [Usitatibacteraceae bacterium]|nr:tetratricopeptide repeat protein [Usitatibacteraceae bacterium]